MNQIPEPIQPHLNDPFPMQMNPNMNIMNQPNMTPIINNQQNLPQNLQIQPGLNQQMPNNPQNEDTKRHRRSKHEQEGRTFACNCGKAFLSKPALNNHIKTKHPELLQGQDKRGRGRPRKYPPRTVSDFESTKYESFFSLPKRKAEEGVKLNMTSIVEKVFNSIYLGPYKSKLFSQPKNYQENPILNNLATSSPLPNKQKNEKTCDDAFYEYLNTFKDKANENYFTLLLKFVLLFRECYDVSKNKENTGTKEAVTNKLTPEGLPDLCNEFYGEFMEPNNFFGIEDQEDKNEIIEIIQHFCIWLFKGEYTKSKLSLASSS